MASITAESKESYVEDVKDVKSVEDSVEEAYLNRLPTEEERATLRLVSAPVPWVAYAIALVELAERASYYGCSGGTSTHQVLFHVG
ncbi:hypothetical protein H0H93_016482 [Arthromyces matolae]|nr:hypothetical protein H0H93_016482 [Arthromyces matolae]